MGKKIVIVGGVAGGASVAARVRRIDESAEIILLEKGPDVSFSNCSLPYYLSRTVKTSDALVMMCPKQFKKQYNIEARVNNEVVKIKRDEKKIVVKNLADGKEYEESYDELVLSPGAVPVRPRSIEGIMNPNVFTIRNVVDIKKLDDYLAGHNVKDVAVVGGGFIGVEVTENLVRAGKQVSLVEALDQIMAPFDFDMAQILHKEMFDQGVNLVLGDGVKKIAADSIELQSGRKVPAQAVVLAIGVRPETELAKDAGLEIGETGGIKVDHNYRTSDRHIYAVGDAIEVFNQLTHKPGRLALAGPAQMQARAAADEMYGIPYTNKGVIGSSVVQVFDLKAASTGLNEKTAKAAGIPYDIAYVIPTDKVGLMPGSNPLHFKLLYECPTGKILGAQAIGKGEADKRIDVIAALISMGGTLEDLKAVELCYAPLFSTAKDVVNFAALVGLNLLNKKYRQVRVSDVRKLVESNAFIVDVREKQEYEHGHIVTAVNIPLSEIRDRMNEIPKDRPVYVHCLTGQRSYNAVLALQGNGYDNVYNISGSFLGVCAHEYYLDKVTGRKSIVTAYKFNFKD
jgi:NADPH-dependent 2,4-dienoyl-CoA reductase/sulfur reductase-like enzyme/rhodanese-related sulfurtransferase